MDDPAGLFFGAMLASYFVLEKKGGLWLYLAFPGMVLVLFKPMMYPFVLVAGAVILFDQLIINRQLTKAKLRVISHFLAVILLPALVAFSWHHWTKNFPISLAWGVKDLIVATQQGQSPFDFAYVNHVLPHYKDALYAPAFFIIALLAWLTLTCYFTKSNVVRSRLLISHTVLLAGFMVYIAMMLLIYLYQMSDVYTQQSMFSFNRFMMVYIIGWAMTALAQTFYLAKQPLFSIRLSYPLKKTAMIIVSLAFFVSVGLKAHHEQQKLAAKNSWRYLHNEMQFIAAPILRLTEPHAHIEMLWVGWARMHMMQEMLAYSLFPRPVMINIADKNYPDSNVAARGKDFGTATEFVTNAAEYDYLLLGYVDAKFWQRYGQFFNDVTHPIPVSSISLCVNSDFYAINDAGCTLRQVPVYLYRVVRTGKQAHFVNVAISL